MTNITKKEPIAIDDEPVITSVDPELADEMGAFNEDALSDEDAIDSLFDYENIGSKNNE